MQSWTFNFCRHEAATSTYTVAARQDQTPLTACKTAPDHNTKIMNPLKHCAHDILFADSLVAVLKLAPRANIDTIALYCSVLNNQFREQSPQLTATTCSLTFIVRVSVCAVHLLNAINSCDITMLARCVCSPPRCFVM